MKFVIANIASYMQSCSCMFSAFNILLGSEVNTDGIIDSTILSQPDPSSQGAYWLEIISDLGLYARLTS